MKTIETKNVANAQEAVNIINRLNYRNDSFSYRFSTFSNDYQVEYRHFDAFTPDGEKDRLALIEIVAGGKLQAVRFFNFFHDLTVDLLFGGFIPDRDRFDNVIDANEVPEESTGDDDLETYKSMRRWNVLIHSTDKRGRHIWKTGEYIPGTNRQKIIRIDKDYLDTILITWNITVDRFLAAEREFEREQEFTKASIETSTDFVALLDSTNAEISLAIANMTADELIAKRAETESDKAAAIQAKAPILKKLKQARLDDDFWTIQDMLKLIRPHDFAILTYNHTIRSIDERLTAINSSTTASAVAG